MKKKQITKPKKQAGKGDKPRKVNKNKWDNNYDSIK